MWYQKNGTHHVVRTSAKGRVAHRSVEISTTQLNQLTEDIIELSGDIDYLTFAIGQKAGARLRRPPTKPPLVPGQSRGARAQAQARAAKQAQKQASRERAVRERGAQQKPKD